VFGVHWIWLLLLFMMVVVVVVAVLAITFAMRPKAPMQPTLSPDGRFWWDGHEWRPMPEPGTPPNSK
jgi:hypothetical protein